MRRAAHLLVVLVGLLVVAYPFTLGATTQPTCRGVPMRPGEACAKVDGTATQTYEQRVQAARDARPVIVGVGVVLTGFGTAVLVSDRARRPDPRTARR